jgi:hypothetical protein
MRKSSILTGIALLIGLASASSAMALDHTYVRLGGDDTKSCADFVNACQTLAAALAQTFAGGTIQCLDASAEHKSFTIDKSIVIDCIDTNNQVVSPPGGGGVPIITVNAPGGTVILRGLAIRGGGGGTIGISVVDAAAVIIEDSAISGIATAPALGIKFAPTAAGSQLIVKNTIVAGNGIAPSTGGGLQVAPAGGTAGVILENVTFTFNVTAMALISGSGGIGATLRRSTVSSSRSNGILALAGSGIAFYVETSSLTNNVGSALQASGANAVVRISDSLITNNQTGVSSVGGGVVQSFKNNRILGNVTDGTPLAAATLQ